MRDWLAIAAVVVVLAATPAWTQMRGGGQLRGARPAIGAPIGQHGSFRPRFVPQFSPSPFVRRAFIGHGFGPPFFVGHGARFHHHGPRFIFFSSFGWPYAYSPGYYPWYPLFSDTYDVSSNAYGEQSYQLQQQVDQLSYEVQRLREEQAERSAPPPSPPQQPQPQSSATTPQPTTLVFRDGRTQKVNNYAIAGGTLWVFTEQRARKIPLSDLDIPATRETNEEQGVPFQVPPPAR